MPIDKLKTYICLECGKDLSLCDSYYICTNCFSCYDYKYEETGYYIFDKEKRIPIGQMILTKI